VSRKVLLSRCLIEPEARLDLKYRAYLLVCVLFASLSAIVLVGHVSESIAAVGGGMVHGRVYGRNYMGDLKPLAWANVTVTNGTYTQSASTAGDGYYMMYVPVGEYTLTASLVGFNSSSTFLPVTNGSTTQYDFYLEQSNEPIPEFSLYVAPAVSILGLWLSLAVLRRRKRS